MSEYQYYEFRTIHRQLTPAQRVEDLIEQKTNDTYQKAVALLQQLGELAREQGRQQVFAARLEEIRKRHSRRTAFTRELQRIKL